jgi:hypothetical protein
VELESFETGLRASSIDSWAVGERLVIGMISRAVGEYVDLGDVDSVTGIISRSVGEYVDVVGEDVIGAL